MFKKLLSRFSEPSTWAGLSVIGALFGLNPAYLTSVHGLITAAAAAAAVFIPEAAAQ